MPLVSCVARQQRLTCATRPDKPYTLWLVAELERCASPIRCFDSATQRGIRGQDIRFIAIPAKTRRSRVSRYGQAGIQQFNQTPGFCIALRLYGMTNPEVVFLASAAPLHRAGIREMRRALSEVRSSQRSLLATRLSCASRPG